MDYEWDPNKADINWANHRVSFKAARRFEWAFALEARDDRKPYAEVRTSAIGFIGARLHVLVYTRRGIRCRVISLRKARSKEVARYAEFTEDLV
jgi:uncharacterized DUF497 family protein